VRNQVQRYFTQMKCQHHQNLLHHYLYCISNNSFYNLRGSRDSSVRVDNRARTADMGFCVQNQAGAKGFAPKCKDWLCGQISLLLSGY
jgi:hypothetical protein